MQFSQNETVLVTLAVSRAPNTDNTMNSHTRIRIFTIIAFILIAGVLYIGYNRMQENTRSLLQTVDENARPAEDLLRIKELWISFNRTSTDIRSFAVTRDDNYLSGFLEMKDTLIAGIDSLKAKAVTSGRPIDDLLELESALDKKVSIYDSLLEINYNRVMISAIEKMKPEDLEVDTASVVLNEGNFFQRSFTRKYSRKALQAKVDSMILARSERISSFKQNLSKIREEEERLLAEQSQKELALLADDKKVTGEIERLIKKLESDEQARIKEKAAASVKTAGEAAIAIRQIMIAGLGCYFLAGNSCFARSGIGW
jgi:CHASE3 domain sensor protein